MEIFNMITSLISGLALFLYGMDTMSGALSQMTGGGLEMKLGKLTQNKFKGFLAGTFLTAIAQSSSVTTVLTVGLVNAGIIKLAEAVGLIIGANLGTTATAWLLSLNALPGGTILLTLCKPSSFTPFLAIAGVAILMFTRSIKRKNIGSALIGFSVMMIGMNMMSAAMSPLKDIPSFQKMLISFENPLYGYLAALLFTLLIQSSDATIGILEAIAISMPFSFGMAIPLICGAQCGSCISAILSSMGASNNGKRTALIHLYYNLCKTIPFLIIFYILNAVFHFSFLQQSVGTAGIPIFHSLINVAAAAIYLPVSGIFVRLAELTVPYSDRERQEKENTLTMLDPLFLSNPSLAIEQVKNALNIMARNTSDIYVSLVKNESREQFDVLYDRNMKFSGQIIKYLTNLSGSQLDDSMAREVRYGQKACELWERIGTMTANVYALREKIVASGVKFTEEAVSDLKVLGESVMEIVGITAIDFEKSNDSISESIKISREIVSNFHGIIHEKHINRLSKGICAKASSSPFIDLCYNFEKIIDACDEVASGMVQYNQEFGINSTNLNKGKSGDLAAYIKALYQDKYEMLMKGYEKGLPH